MSLPPSLANVMKAVGLDPAQLEAVLTIDGSPLFAFVAPEGTAADLPGRIEAAAEGPLQAVVLGATDAIERFRQCVDDDERGRFIKRPRLEDVLADAETIHRRLVQMEDDLDRPLPERHDTRSVLVHAVSEQRVLTASELTAALAAAPWIEVRRPPVPPYDDEPETLAAPTVAGQWIGLFPLEQPHEVLARMRIGGFNACPHTAVHVAVLRRWERALGARLLALEPDELVLRVARPPATQRAVHIARLEQAHLGGDERPSVGETKAGVWRWWWD